MSQIATNTSPVRFESVCIDAPIIQAVAQKPYGLDEVALRMADRNGALRVALNVSTDEVPALRLYDSQSRPRTLLGVDSDGDGALDFYESNGRLLRELP